MADRTIAGTVKSDGGIIYGTEFSVNRVSEGHYIVSFRPGFAQVGGASATQIYDGDTRDNAVIIKLSTTELFVKVGDSSGNPRDRDFTFVAVGSGANVAVEAD